MKRALLISLVFFAFTCLADAHLNKPPDLGTMANSDAIYLVKAISVVTGPDSVHPVKITFVVTDVLRGEAKDKLMLTAYENDAYKENTEFIIVHHPGGLKDCIGWPMAGYCEWFPLQVTRDGDKSTAQWIGPLDKVREYLAQHPKKP